jgi:DUF438 domain-containing protein
MTNDKVVQHIAPEGHPVWILMEEHALLLEYAGKLVNTVNELGTLSDFASAQEKLGFVNHLLQHFRDSAKHYLREENVLFPYIEKKGITSPPAMMWREHDQIRTIEKELYTLEENRNTSGYQDFVNGLRNSSLALLQMLNTHFYKENHILFPASMEVLSDKEWQDVRRQFDNIGYCCFTPEAVRKPVEEQAIPTAEKAPEGVIQLETGYLTKEQLETMLNTLPIELTFVDHNDTVKYYSRPKEMVFSRSKAVIGREVRLCHPQKSLHLVDKIVKEFKAGTREVAEFWANVGGKFVHIRYFAVRNAKGEYLGAVELAQNVTEIRKLEGEKRLLD